MEDGRDSEGLDDGFQLEGASGQVAIHASHHDIVLKPVLSSHIPVSD